MAAWLRHQADEEIVHANKFIDHTLDRGSHPRIGTIEAPEVEVGLSALEDLPGCSGPRGKGV